MGLESMTTLTVMSNVFNALRFCGAESKTSHFNEDLNIYIFKLYTYGIME